MSRGIRKIKHTPPKRGFRKFRDSDYYVSIKGVVFSGITGKYLKGANLNGYTFFDFRINQKPFKALQHRLIAELFIPNPKGYPIVRHLNDNKSDIRISNLAWGTQLDNVSDGKRNGRYGNSPSFKGEQNWNCRLTSEQVMAIRKEAKEGTPNCVIAKKYQIANSYVCNIKSGKTWKHLPI